MALGNIARRLQARALAKGNPGAPGLQRADQAHVANEQRKALHDSRRAAHDQQRTERKSDHMNARMMRRQARKKAMSGIGPG